jgi:tetratricopeptide (TPR) repeat protein
MKKLGLPLVLVATIALGGALGYGIWKVRPLTAEAYLESAKTYYDQKKYLEAIIQSLNTLQKDARNRDARYLLSLSYMAQQDLPHAVGALRALLEYYPHDVEANLQLGRIYLTAGRGSPDLFRQARELADHILSKDPNNVNALILLGNAAAGLQDYNASVESFEKALGLDPQNLSAVVGLGTTQTLQKNYPDAERAFLRAREIRPQDKDVLISLANYYGAVGDNAKAELVFQEVLSLYPAERAVYLQVVNFYNRLGRFQDVEKALRNAQAKSDQSPEPSLALADLYMAKDQPAAARKLLLELKEKFPKDLDVASKVALNFIVEQPDQAQAEIDEILTAAPQNPVGHVLLGELQFLSGRYDDAEKTLGSPPAVDGRFPQVHFFLGNLALRKNQVDQAVVHYQQSLSVNSRYVPARTALAEVFLNRGKVEDSKEEIRKALEVKPDYVPARLLRASAESANKNFAGAEEELKALAKQEPDNALVYRQMALYSDSRGRTADAEKNLLHALDLKPESPELIRDLTLLYIRTKQTDKAVKRIKAIPDAKKDANYYELLGLAYSQGGKVQDAETAYKKALEKDPSRVSTDTYLFQNYMRGGRLDEALKVVDDIIRKNPNSVGAYGVKGHIYETQGRIDEAKRYYTEALKIDSTAEGPANNVAYILAEQGTDLQTALGYAQTARRKQPDNPSIADTLGWVHYKLGNYVLARAQLEFAISKQPDNAEFQYHLGMIYKANKQLAEAEKALRKAGNSPQDFKEKGLAQSALRETTSSK